MERQFSETRCWLPSSRDENTRLDCAAPRRRLGSADPACESLDRARGIEKRQWRAVGGCPTPSIGFMLRRMRGSAKVILSPGLSADDDGRWSLKGREGRPSSGT